MNLTFTTNPGLEDIVRDEFGERLAAGTLADRGVVHPEPPASGRVAVGVEASERELRPIALAMRSVHHVIRDVTRFPLPAGRELESIRDRLTRLDLPGLETGTPFRVTSVRAGSHAFTSMDVQAAAGAGIQARTGAPVSLRNYRLHVEVDVLDDQCLVGMRWTDRALSLRLQRPYERRVALSANVAYALLRLARAGSVPAAILDPCCGTGTILLEAGSIHPDARLVGSDTDQRSVEGAARNLAHYNLAHRARTLHADARELATLAAAGPFDAIVTNPPFGRRLGRRIDFRRFYRELLDGARAIIAPDGRLVLLVDRRGLFNAACRDNGCWHIRDVRIIELGGIHPGIFVLAPA